MREEIITNILSAEPFIAVCDSGLSDEILNKLSELPVVEDSLLTFSDDKEVRMSKTLYFGNTNVLTWLTETIIDQLSSQLNEIYTIDDSEAIQITKYPTNGYFVSHCDFINQDPNGHKVDRDRIATAILYINDNFEGGRTVFPLLDIKVTPKKGQILYYSYNPQNTPLEVNLKTEHAGELVTQGEKIIAVQLFLEKQNE
jgi:prolyl 4-hydroxylase